MSQSNQESARQQLLIFAYECEGINERVFPLLVAFFNPELFIGNLLFLDTRNDYARDEVIENWPDALKRSEC